MVQEALGSAAGNRERIRASFQAYFDFVEDQADGFRLLMQETVGAEREFRDRVARTREQILSEVADLIVRESGGKLDRMRAETGGPRVDRHDRTVAQHDPGVEVAAGRRGVDTRWRWPGEVSPSCPCDASAPPWPRAAVLLVPDATGARPPVPARSPGTAP